MIQAEGQHRDHAIVEQVIAGLGAGPLAGTRYARARTATIRRDLVTMPARTARHGRGNLVLHLPAGHHREQALQNLWTEPADRPHRRPDQPEPGPHPHAARQNAPRLPPRNPGHAAEPSAAGNARPKTARGDESR
jgi:hypothetical protein